MKKIKDNSIHPFIIHVGDSFDVFEEKTIKEGKNAGNLSESLVGYYASLPIALNVIITEKTKRSYPEKEIITLAEYYKTFETVTADIKSAFNTGLT